MNSILILGQQLAENPDGNLEPRQIEFARTIYGAGTDLLNLISDILDLSKIESGTVSVDAEDIVISNLVDIVARPFRHEAEGRKLAFTADIQPDTPQIIVTDSKRLQQVLKNLLSNAFKFTLEGEIRLRIGKASEGWTPKSSPLSTLPLPSWCSRSRIPALASRSKSKRSYLRPSNRLMRAPAENLAAPALGWQSAANWPPFSVAKSSCAARREKAAHSRSICPRNMRVLKLQHRGPSGRHAANQYRLAPRAAIATREVETVEDDG